jgi:chromosome segregation ATPase
MKKTIRHPKEIPATVHVVDEPPPLENEPPHRKLARLMTEHAKTTEQLQELKRNFAAENIKAQQCRQTIPTSQLTFVENKKRELAGRLMELQAEIGKTNKEVRAHKAGVQSRKAKQPWMTDREATEFIEAVEVPMKLTRVRNGVKQISPLKKHLEFAKLLLPGLPGRIGCPHVRKDRIGG